MFSDYKKKCSFVVALNESQKKKKLRREHFDSTIRQQWIKAPIYRTSTTHMVALRLTMWCQFFLLCTKRRERAETWGRFSTLILKLKTTTTAATEPSRHADGFRRTENMNVGSDSRHGGCGEAHQIELVLVPDASLAMGCENWTKRSNTDGG